MRKSRGYAVYAFIVIVVLILAAIFGVMMLQGAISHTDPASVSGTNLSGVNQTVGTVLTGLFSASMIPVWLLILAGFCLVLYLMIRAGSRR